jgi:TetR/AcrR family transcriptional repressor of bet genes
MKPKSILPRKASRERRRQQLIEATIKTIAKRGYSQTTLTDVAATAGVSHGLVNFHFHTKEKLLAETLLSMAEEYQSNWAVALAEAAPDPASQLNALITADFNDAICTPDKLAAWCAFWGEAQSRPIYLEQCGANDRDYNAMKEEVCRRLVAEGGYAIDAARAARVLRVTIEGVWLDLLAAVEPYSKDEAMKTVYFCAAAFFPDHFSVDGLKLRR